MSEEPVKTSVMNFSYEVKTLDFFISKNLQFTKSFIKGFTGRQLSLNVSTRNWIFFKKN